MFFKSGSGVLWSRFFCFVKARGDEKMDEKIKKQIVFALEDDNELMTAALEPDSDLDDKNKEMNRALIQEHEKILAKIENDEPLTQHDLVLIKDANEMDINDVDNVRGHHGQAIALNEWLEQMTELTKEQAMKILEGYLDRDSHTPAKVYRALHTLWEEATPDGVAKEPAFGDKGKCLKCGSKVSFADVTDTIVYVGDEIVKRHDGDITNRNCVKCNYPERYGEYEHYDDEAS